MPPPTVRIERIAAGGEGVGRLGDGRVVFAHRTAPGDLVELELTQQRARWTRGRLVRVLEPAPDRRDAPCRFYADCGGCTVEHLQYPAQLHVKRQIVTDALQRIGGLPLQVEEVVGSPKEFRYRNRVSFALRRLAGGRVVAGFHTLGDPARVVDLDGSCLLPEPAISRAWDSLRNCWGVGASRLPGGVALRLTLRTTVHGEVSLLVEGGEGPGDPDGLIRDVPELVAVWHRAAGEPPGLVAGTPGLPETWGEETLELGGAAFLQVNRGAAELLEAHVVREAGQVSGRTVVDAYCGVGLHARRLARLGARVVGIELDADALSEARRAAPAGAAFELGPVEALLPLHLPADLVVVNPPRAGLGAGAVDALRADPPERMIYISCDPATLARDLRRLAPALEVVHVRCFDLFPQTAHVETVVSLKRPLDLAD